VGLDENRFTRNYLFGRLLAAADMVETSVLKSKDESRVSNAFKYMHSFSRKPCAIWKFLYIDKMPPYLKQLKPGLRSFYLNSINDIMDKFNPDEFNSDEPLDGEFLLGFHCQLKDFWHKRKNRRQNGQDNNNNKE
jgi:CRISPR-associated protein Csd1